MMMRAAMVGDESKENQRGRGTTDPEQRGGKKSLAVLFPKWRRTQAISELSIVGFTAEFVASLPKTGTPSLLQASRLTWCLVWHRSSYHGLHFMAGW